MPSVLNVDTLVAANGTDPVTLTKQSAAKAWCYISSNGTVVSGSLNVGSVTDNGVGSYQPNFSSNMVDVNFNETISSNSHANGMNCESNKNLSTTSQFRIFCTNSNETALVDYPNTSGTIHGDLA